MKIILIAAHDQNKLIGNGDKLPWKCRADMKHFKETTTGHVVIMGRKTWESFGSRPLPKRTNIVLTRDPDSIIRNSAPSEVVADVWSTVEGALEYCRGICAKNNSDLYVIGGAEIYKLFMPIADEAIISVIHCEYEGDVYFPGGLSEQFGLISSDVVSGNDTDPSFTLTKWLRLNI